MIDGIYLLCPNATQIYVQGLPIFGDSSFKLSVTAKQLAYDDNLLDDNSILLTSEITFYFDPEEYLNVGYQKAIVKETEFQLLNSLVCTHISSAISKTAIEFFSFKWLDTSSISALKFSKELVSWNVESKTKNTSPGRPQGFAIFTSLYTQSRSQYTITWSVQSLDIVLGLVGGVSGVVWAVFAYTIGDFEAFRYENALIGSIYPTSPF